MSVKLLAIDKLRSSGLDAIGLDALHMQPLTAEETSGISPTFAPCPSLRINYIDPRTAQPMRHRPGFPPFFRIRYLGPTVPTQKDGKPIRYMQPSNIGVCAYFAPVGQDWPSVLKDTDVPLVFTEGELKAAKACSMGVPTIGLGGVSNLVAHKTGYDLLPELVDIEWPGRRVIICFDNDGRSNPNVVAALNTLAQRLESFGAIPFTVNLPDPISGGKMGLDDYFLEHTLHDFVALCESKESMTIAQSLWRMNERFVKVCDPMSVVDLNSLRPLQLASFKAHYDNNRVPEQLLNKDGDMSYKLVPLADRWLSWPLRTSVSSITYAPGQPRFLESPCDLNLWSGWGSEPKKGDIKPFVQLLDYIFGTDREGKVALKWFLQWAAYPIQNPGGKLLSAVVIWSENQGVGKSFLAYILGAIYGKDNWREVGQRDLAGSFTGWVKNKQFIIGNEITGSDSHEVADQIKGLITSPTVPVNEKYIPEYELPNVCNFIFNSNRPSAVFIDDKDRRFFIWEVVDTARKPEFFAMLDLWFKNPDSISAVHHFLLNVDLSDFNPTVAPPMTSAKEDMIEAGRSSHANWCHRLKATPDYFLRHGNAPLTSDLYTSQEMLNLFKKEDAFTTLKATGMAQTLRSAGFERIQQLRWHPKNEPERQDRFFIIRNAEKWAKATPLQIRKHVEATKGGVL